MKALRGVLLVAVLMAVLSGCYAHSGIQKTQLQIREFQTRIYKTDDTNMVMKACLNALQDSGFIVKNMVPGMGLLTAEKTGNAPRTYNNLRLDIKINIAEASVNITTISNETRVRANFIVRGENSFGGKIFAKQIEDEETYQKFFSIVDKSIFIQKEGI